MAYSFSGSACSRCRLYWSAFARCGQATNLAPAAQKDAPGQCFLGAEKFDVLAAGKKIAGAAQRRNRRGLLIQGSVQPAPGWPRVDWEKAMCDVAANEWGVAWQLFAPNETLDQAAQTLTKEKYSQKAHNEKR